MQIVIDAREHALIDKLRLIAPEIYEKILVEQLLLGDALIRTSEMEDRREILLFERKSLTDLLASIKDGRYEEQSHRIIHTSGLHPHNVIYVIEGAFSSLRNPADKKIILSAMTSLSYFKGFSVFRTMTVLETAELILAMSSKLEKEFAKGRDFPLYASPKQNIFVVASAAAAAVETKHQEDEFVEQRANEQTADEQRADEQRANKLTELESYSSFVKKAKRDNITPENIGEILLCQIPGISSHIAKSVLSNFVGSFLKLIEDIKTQPEKLNAILVETTKGDGKRRKLSTAVIQSILRFLRG
jgi:ERCC4-type nuclease